MTRRVPSESAEERLRAMGAATPLPLNAAPSQAENEAATGTIRAYEDLDGAEGRAVFFRPHRHSAADLAPLRSTVVLLADGVTRDCALRDVSQNGVAFACPHGVHAVLRQRLEIAVRFDDHEAFRGAATVGSVRDEDGTVVVGVSFDGFLLDVEEVLQLRTVRRWKDTATDALAGKARWSVPGCNRYKALVAELRLLFQDTEDELRKVEAQLPWHVLHGKENAARDALVTQLTSDFVPKAIRLSEDIDEAVRELPGGHGDPAAKEWSHRCVDEYLLQSPGCHRARHKPFGYPGDYEVMNFIYGQPFEGATLFARAVELAFWHSASARAVRARKDLVKQRLEALVAARAPSRRPLRVLSIAAGPAQELAEFFAEVDALPAQLEIVLFEQDKGALAHAWRRLEPMVSSRFPGQVRLVFLHDSIKRLLRDPKLFEPLGPFDLIYCAGLLDYLQQLTAVRLTRNLASAAAREGGTLLVANMVDHPARWFLEVPLDWPLVYRTRNELLDVGVRAQRRAQVRVVDEESGANPFLELVRP
jgi:extracellular factor (EF) 3-hydroxypalmitic acid methyl ester biosynthesis protein